MGSSGSGRLSDYSRTSSKGSSKTGGSSNEDKCAKAFTESLEDVERSDYFKKEGTLPATGTKIRIVFKKPRLAAVTADDTTIGFLPTGRNYVRACIEAGYEFPGAVSSARSKPVSSIQVTVSPHK